MNPISSFVTYLRSAKVELEKVTWPTRQETLRYSALVIAVCVATAVFFATLDFGLGQGIDALLRLRPGGTPTAPAAAPVVPDLVPTPGSVEAVDENGNPTNVNIETIPTGSGEFSPPIQVTP